MESFLLCFRTYVFSPPPHTPHPPHPLPASPRMTHLCHVVVSAVSSLIDLSTCPANLFTLLFPCPPPSPMLLLFLLPRLGARGPRRSSPLAVDATAPAPSPLTGPHPPHHALRPQVSRGLQAISPGGAFVARLRRSARTRVNWRPHVPTGHSAVVCMGSLHGVGGY